MTWNYRILAYDGGFALHEVYYDRAGAPTSWTETPVSFACFKCEGVEGIIGSLEMAIADALKHPVLTVSDGRLVPCDSGSDSRIAQTPPGSD